MMIKKLLVIGLLIGALHALLYFLVLSIVSVDGITATTQPDTELYCQAARRICEGHPFSYSCGEAVSTGTTSVLHPFVLAIPYWLGAKGNHLLESGFVLNTLFYLIFLSSWILIGARTSANNRSCTLFAIILALSSHPIYCAMGQTDIGLWMCWSSMLIASLVWQRWNIAAIFAIVAPWIRPEGVVIALAIVASMPFAGNQKRHYATIGSLAVLSALAVFCFNYGLTGRFQFDSVAHKGYFKTASFANAISHSASDAVTLFKTYLLGLPHSDPFTTFFVPFLSAVFLWAGIASRSWKRVFASGLGVAILGAFGSIAIVASSGWVSTNYDRYLAWIVPLVYLFIAEGAHKMSTAKSIANVKYLPLVIIIGYSLFGSVFSLAVAADIGKRTSSEFEFHAFCEELMASEDCSDKVEKPRSVGGLACGAAYYFGNRRFHHFAGLYSPAFFETFNPTLIFDFLKHRSELRPFYLLSDGIDNMINPADREKVLGRILAIGPDYKRALHVADWTTFDRGAAIPAMSAGKSLVDRLDVGYIEDEKAHDYEVIDRWRMRPREVFIATEKLKGETALDAGRIIRGGDMMTVPLQPGKDCEVVVRTLGSRDGVEFNSPIKILLNVDGEDVGYVGYDLNLKTNAFQEVSFTIPGKAIRQTPSRIGFLGDHIACGYWFFQ